MSASEWAWLFVTLGLACMALLIWICEEAPQLDEDEQAGRDYQRERAQRAAHWRRDHER